MWGFLLPQTEPSVSAAGSESADPWSLLAFAPACLPRECPFSETISRNRPWTARACSPPCMPNRGSACRFPRGRKSNRWEDPGRGWSGPPSTAWNDSRCREISAAAHCRWEEETARREKHRRKEKCSRRCGRRCTETRPSCLRPAQAEARRILPRCPPVPDY